MKHLGFIFLGFIFLGVACKEKEASGQSSKPSTPPVITASTTEVRMDPGGKLVYRPTGRLFTGLLRESGQEGRLLAEVNFRDGVRHGFAREWHGNGELSLEGEWENGVPKGVISEWSEDGLIRRETMYRDGKIAGKKEGPSKKAAQQVKRIVKERETLNQTVWSEEEQAQKYEATFVGLWDQLREKDHSWDVFDLFPFQSVQLGNNPVTRKHDWDIEETTLESGGDVLSWDDW